MSKSEDSTSHKIAELTLKISKIKVLEEESSKVKAFNQVELKLAKIDSDLTKYEPALDLMIANKIEIENVESISTIDQMTNDYEKSFQKNSDSVEAFTKPEIGKGNITHDYLPKCQKLDEDLDNALNLSWYSWVYEKLPENLNLKVTNTLSRVAHSDLKSKVSDIAKKLERIDNIASELPKEKNVLQDLDEKVQSVKKLWNEVNIDSKTDFTNITKFLRDALEDEGAKYEDFTPEIKDWFEKHGEMENARIKFLSKKSFN